MPVLIGEPLLPIAGLPGFVQAVPILPVVLAPRRFVLVMHCSSAANIVPRELLYA